MLAEMLAQKGRKGDDTVAHVGTGEIIVPAQVLAMAPELEAAIMTAFEKAGVDPGRYRVGGDDDSVNPETGMPEYNFDFGFDDETEGWADYGGDGASDFGGGYEAGNTGSGYGGSPEHGPHHAQTVNQGFAGDKRAVDVGGSGPSELPFSFLGFSPATNYNRMTGQNVTGASFNPGRLAGGMLGGLALGPLGGIAGSMLGGRFADSSYMFPGVTGGGPRQDMGPDITEGEGTLAAILRRGSMGAPVRA